MRRARILPLADEDRIDRKIASSLGSAMTTVERMRERFVEEGLEAVLDLYEEPYDSTRPAVCCEEASL